jgi:UDP-N-acetylglucosamine acyltransferase
VLADDPQDVGFDCSKMSYVEIGEGCVLREGVTIHRATQEGKSTRIGAGSYLMANSHVAHDCVVGKKVVLVNGTLLGGHVSIGDGALLAGNCGVHQFVRVGRLAMVGAGAIAVRDVPPFFTCSTNEASTIGGLNLVGMRRAGFDAKERQEVKEAYRLLYRKGLTVKAAVEAIRRAFSPGSPGFEVADFVAASERGICRPH